MIKTNILKCHFASRLIMACLMAVGSFACALADNKVTIESFNIKPGEEKTVAVCLDNSDRITALQMDIALPDGIVYVANSLTRDEVRLDRDYHSLFMSTLSDGNLRLLIVPSDTVSIFGDSGAVAYFKVKAENSFVKAGKIDFTNILGSSHEKGEDGYTKSFPMADFSADVAPYVGKLYTAADTLAIKTDGTSKKVSLVLDNFINVRGMQALITLPQGLSFEVKDNGKPKFEYGSRLPQNATISSNMTSDGKLKIAVAGMTTENFAGTTGEVLAFYVKADETLALKSDLVINDVIVSNENGNAFGLYDEVKLSVTNSYLAHYTPAKALVDSLRNLYNEAVDSIAANAANVKDNEDILAAEAAIVAKIDSLQKVVDDSYANETLAEGLADVQAGADDIATSIKALVENALAAQGNKEAVNEEAYKRLTAQITSLQTELDAAKETINTECKDVASQFTEVIDSIQTRITAISDSVKTAYEAVELTSESTIDSLSVKASIAQLLVDAKAAQAVTANEAAYNRLTAEIASLQTELDAAKETINTECKDVVSQFTEVIDSIQTRITEISDSVKAAYEVGELTAESTIDSQSVKDSIEKLLSEAKAAQTVVDANEAAYARLTEELEALQAELDSAEETVNTECKDVADQFVDDIKAIQDEIDEISEKVESDYEAVKLTEESTIDSQTVKDAIANLLADAEKAQKEYEEATGIYGITIDDIQNGDVEVYDITGKKLNSLVRGKLNIVKYSNGKIYKIQVK